MPARRVLVPLLVLALAAALFLWRREPEPIVEVASDVSACTANLRAIYAGLGEYHARHGRLPSRSGVAFLGALIGEGVWPDAPEERARLTCPGPGAERVPAGSDYSAASALTGSASGYAARLVAEHPLAKFPAGGPERVALVACDNARTLNHDGCMNVLFSDGSVVTLVLAQEIEHGRLPAGTTTIRVGRDSPLAELRELAPD